MSLREGLIHRSSALARDAIAELGLGAWLYFAPVRVAWGYLSRITRSEVKGSPMSMHHNTPLIYRAWFWDAGTLGEG